jgi:hypothetical protein
MKLFLWLTALGSLVLLPIPSGAGSEVPGKTGSLRGTVYRGDRAHPVADALIDLNYDFKEDKTEERVSARTDAEGNYSFKHLLPEGYSISIRTWHPSADAVPCKLTKARTKDKNSSVSVRQDGDRFVEQVWINYFRVRSGQALVRDFDLTCLDRLKK